MNDIYIFGAGGFAKEVFLLIQNINKSKGNIFKVIGFVDTKNGELKIGNQNLPIFKEDEIINKLSADVSLAIGIGSPNIIKTISEKYKNIYRFPNLIDPSIDFHESNLIGEGNIICAGVKFTVDIKVHSFNVINLSVTVGHDTIIGSFNVINPGANISGNVKIGDENLIGTNATVLQNLIIGNKSMIGAGSVITKNTESSGVYVGVPGKLKNYISD